MPHRGGLGASPDPIMLDRQPLALRINAGCAAVASTTLHPWINAPFATPLDPEFVVPTILSRPMISFSILLLFALLAACIAVMMLEFRGVPTTIALNVKGDLKRETRWLAQYGQGGCTLVTALLVWQLDQEHRKGALAVVAAVVVASALAVLLKRLLSRVRPGRENAGRFLGPSWKHANWRESFPSSHSASAVAFSVVLVLLYPPAAITFWILALVCVVIRYVMEAHWPSDILAGIALGYGVGHLAWWLICCSELFGP